MSFIRPTLQQLRDRDASDIESRLPGTDARLRFGVLSSIAKTHAGGTHGLYGYLDWLARQIFADTADYENIVRAAAVYGMTPTQAEAAVGNITFTGTDGTIIPALTGLQRSDGELFTTDAEATIAGGAVI